MVYDKILIDNVDEQILYEDREYEWKNYMR